MTNDFGIGVLFGTTCAIFIFGLLFLISVAAGGSNNNENRSEATPVEAAMPFREFEPRPGVLCYEGYQKLSCVKE